MVTRNKKEDFEYLINRGYFLPDVIAFFMRVSDVSTTRIAMEAGVTRPMVAMVITGARTSENVQKAISKAIGFNPWGV